MLILMINDVPEISFHRLSKEEFDKFLPIFDSVVQRDDRNGHYRIGRAKVIEGKDSERELTFYEAGERS